MFDRSKTNMNSNPRRVCYFYYPNFEHLHFFVEGKYPQFNWDFLKKNFFGQKFTFHFCATFFNFSVSPLTVSPYDLWQWRQTEQGILDISFSPATLSSPSWGSRGVFRPDEICNPSSKFWVSSMLDVPGKPPIGGAHSICKECFLSIHRNIVKSL